MSASVTVLELDMLLKTIGEKQEAADKVEATLKEMNAEIEGLCLQGKNYLKELDREKYHSPYGLFEIKQRWSVKVPATDADKTALFSWLEEKGIFERYATVNSASLQSLVKLERETWLKEGNNPMDFSIPGLEPATLYETAKLKANK